jgi:hypothetical protein
MLIAVFATTLSLALAARLRASVAPVTSTAGQPQGAVRGLLWAAPFHVEAPFAHFWRKEKPLVSAGYLLVLSVDPEYVRPRETAEPVLYAGDQTVERVNHGFESGRVVAILPSDFDRAGHPTLDLSAIPFWFGAPDLPERIDATEIQVQRGRSEKSGARRFTAAEVTAALRRAGEPLQLARREELEARAGLLVQEHSPEEHDLADGLLVPTSK